MTGTTVGIAEVVVGTGVVGAATVALLVPRRLASVVAFLVLGVLLSVLWALAGAPDVALAEAAIGAGVTGVLFVDTVTRTPPPPRRRVRRSATVTTLVAALALAGGLTAALWRAAEPLPGRPPGLAGPVAQALPETGVDHGVTGVLLNLRSYDTLLEMAVLLAAVLVVMTLTGPDRPGAGPGSAGSPPRVPALQTEATAVLLPVLVLIAAWLLFAGSSRPGGAFQSGAVLAAAVLLVHLAARPVLPPGARRSPALAAAGLAAFTVVAAVGPLLGGAWLELDPSWAGPLIVALETALAASIGASLALIALGLRGEGGR